jgi:diguanylate cyclase (GGDEF)-like protein/PAS domain S-box-containing protein
LVTAAATSAAWLFRDASVAHVEALELLLLPLPPPLAFVGVASIAAMGWIALLLDAGRRRARRRRHPVPPTLTDPAPDPATVDAGGHAEPADAAADTPATTETDADATFVLELDARGRITRCAGTGARTLSERPDQLVGRSLLELVPGRIRERVVESVRHARRHPGEAVHLPMLRLQAPQGGESTAPLRLSFQAGTDGRLRLRGELAHRPHAGGDADLARGDDRFSRVFHSSPDAILIYRHRDGTVIDFNQGFTRLLGYTREDAIGRLARDLDLWVDQERRDAILDSFTRARHVTDVEARLRDADGQARPVELSLRFIELDGELCVLCIARDISKRVAAELAARSSEEKFTQVFSHSPDGVLVLRAEDLLVCDANPAFQLGSGIDAAELVGQPITAFPGLTQDPHFAAILDTLSRDGRVANREMRFQARSGKELTVLVSGTAVEIDGDACLLCIIRDVSDLRHAQEQLRRSEERFRGAFENAPIGILLLDPQGHIFQANRFATELLHYPDRALDSIHVSRLVPADERADLKEQLERLLRGGDPAARSERRMLCADGLEIWTNCHMVVQRGRDGEPLYCILQVADITEMKTSQRRMERLAFYDTLTELANRRLFNDRLTQAVEHCRRHDVRAALLYLDLDQFKRVNDTLGHESGDALLREVATRLLGCVRKEDTVGRPGGDEFTILLYDVENPNQAGRVAEKILRALEEPITISGHQLIVTTSIGITVIPDDGMEPNALTKNADLAMYRAKEKGRNNYQFYSEDLNTNAVLRLRTEHELRRALERSEFELHFQPCVRVADQAVVGVECLLRWNHPERGLVPPDEFIPVAEETGAIVEIGNWVISEACAAGQLLAEQHGGPLTIAVNISPRQFRDPNLVETIRAGLRRAHLDPGCLEIEITETMLMQDVEVAATIIQRLHKLGVSLAIDDFGTGYSSLNYLKKFPISTVKVDRTFVADIPENSDDMEITAAVIAMAHRLRMQVVAEGVETHAQLDFLLEQHCDYAQGFLFSKPLKLQEIGELLGSGNVALLHSGREPARPGVSRA